MTIASDELKIDREFRDLCPPLRADELAGLESSIVADGCLDPVIVWAEESVLLDGHNRHAICKKHGIPFDVRSLSFDSRAAATNWIIDHQLGRRNLAPEQASYLRGRKYLAEKRQGERTDLATSGNFCQRFDSAEKVAKETGVSARTIRNDADFATAVDAIAEVSPEAKCEILAGNVAATRPQIVDVGRIEDPEERLKAARAIVRAEKERKTEARRVRETTPVAPVPAVSDRWSIHHCSALDLVSRVEAGSVDAVICDPPYPKEFLETYEDLAEFADHALKPGGVCLAMCGQTWLPEVIERMSKHLRYHWCLGYFTPGENVPIWPRRVKSAWKPVLWFQKGDYEGEHNDDIVRSDKRAKEFHEWGQSEGGMADLILKFTRPGALVCDPFLGGGTTAVVAVRLERRFVGCDIEEKCVSVTRERIARECA